ncbi:dihydroxyacetone kinase subunit DhaK [Klebsiella pneumoniae]|nr:dihydroxyacetone kinase subunit DhaK [Klebsiella pneumoniae]
MNPAFLGYLGKGLLDAVAVGEVFSSPGPTAFLEAIRVADRGNGVACLFGNYAGDSMNVQMALRLAEDEGRHVAIVKARDDIASAPKNAADKRHGIAGGVLMWKTAGAVAAGGGTLEEVIAVAEQTAQHTRSVCVGLAPCTIPAVGKPNFIIDAAPMSSALVTMVRQGNLSRPWITLIKLLNPWLLHYWMISTLKRDLNLP